MAEFGLIGQNIDYSFSRSYFNDKFEKEGLDHLYRNFDLENIQMFPDLLRNNSKIKGLNVTIPYKESIIPYLDKLDPIAEQIHAVNTIRISETGELTGFNTDWYGFENSLRPLLNPIHKKALILGTGGASKAIEFVLDRLDIDFDFVSRTAKSKSKYTYNDLNPKLIESYTLIINCTPLGTYPDIDSFPPIPYEAVSKDHLLYDLVYNPEMTSFMKKGADQGAQVINGLHMLVLQAEKAWVIWNS